MNRRILAIWVVFYLMGIVVGFSQNDNILKPVDIHPPRPDVQQKPKESDDQLAAQYYRKKEFDKAVILYAKLYKQKKSSIYYTYYLYCLVELEDFKGAEKLVKTQIKKYPTRPKYHVDLGFVYTEKGDLSKAKKQYEDALKNLPPDRNRIIELANAFMYRSQIEYAAATYKKGSEMLPDYPFYLELGNLYNQVGNYSMMVEEYLNYVDFDYMNVAIVEHKLQNKLSDDPDNVVSDLLRKSLLKRVQKHPDKIYYSEMIMWLSIQEKDFEMAFLQAKSIDRRQNEEGERIFKLAEICLANQQYEIAIDAYNYILKKGKSNFLYLDATIGRLNARYLKATESYDYSVSDLINVENDYISMLEEYGKTPSTIKVMQYLGHLQAFYLDKTDEAVSILYDAIAIPNAAPAAVAECKIELADILLFVGDIWEAKLLYAQVEKAYKNDPLGHYAKYKNAKLSFYIGEFQWAKAQLDVLKAATSKLIANDALRFSVLISDNIDMDSSTVALEIYGRADLLLYRNQDELALQTLDSIFELSSWHPIFDEVLLKKAEIKIKQRDFEKAAEYLTMIVEDYSYDITADNALFLLAELNEKQFNDTDKAMQLYQKLMQDYPASLFTVEARKRYRSLRGDFVEEEI
jgi:tetratricopeptide (TPR) repeat protein